MKTMRFGVGGGVCAAVRWGSGSDSSCHSPAAQVRACGIYMRILPATRTQLVERADAVDDMGCLPACFACRWESMHGSKYDFTGITGMGTDESLLVHILCSVNRDNTAVRKILASHSSLSL